MNMSKSATGLRDELGVPNKSPTHQLRFTVNQLACAAIGLPEDHPGHNYIGRLVALSDTEAVLRAFDGQEVTVPANSLKQVVHYDADKGVFIEVGQRASVVNIDHPETGMIYPGEVISTSPVLSKYSRTGFFETRNTVYLPNVVRNPMFGDAGEMRSPYLYAGK